MERIMEAVQQAVTVAAKEAVVFQTEGRVLTAFFGRGRDKIEVPCAFTGLEGDGDVGRYADNIIKAWKKAAK